MHDDPMHDVHRRRAAMCLCALCAIVATHAPAQTITRVSVSSEGAQANHSSSYQTTSADGRYVAFASMADNLVPNDTNNTWDVFVHDRATDETTRVSVSSSGEQGNDRSDSPSMSADGRFVAFASRADNLDPGGFPHTDGWEVYVHDRQTGETKRISVSSDGEPGDRASNDPKISADGRYVAFVSASSNFVPGDLIITQRIFVHDRETGETTRVSVSTDGAPSTLVSDSPSISADGRFVTFSSWSNNLVPGDTNALRDIFVHDRQTGETTRVSMSTDGVQATGGHSLAPSISADGRCVAFMSNAFNLVPDDTNGASDVFVHDRQTGETTRVSVSSEGEQANAGSGGFLSMSADGRFVTFMSFASNLVPDDTNNSADCFIHDRETGVTTRISVSSEGVEGNRASYSGILSADGRFVAFDSLADNLVPDDTNNRTDVFIHDRAPTTPPCPGDLNADGVVDFDDLGQVLSGFGDTYDFDDLGAVLGAFGTTCP